MNTYDKQVIIVKPDFFNEKGLEIIKFYLNKYKVCVDSFYLIDNYKEYNKKFRELEVLSELDNSVDQVSKLESMKITNKAYELMYKNKALLIVINNNNLAPDEFFLRLRLIKVEIREKYVKQRPFKIYLKIENGKESIDLRGKEEILDKNLFYETHLNGIHFAHYNNYQEVTYKTRRKSLKIRS